MQNRTVIVTGANSGIGWHATRALTGLGANMVMVCRSKEKGEKARAELLKEHPQGQADLVLGDISEFDSVCQLAGKLLSKYPEIHVLVNNAGIYTPYFRRTKDGIESTLATNHFGPFLLTALLTPRLIESGPSRIVNVASEAHRVGEIDLDRHFEEDYFRSFKAYGTSKLMNILHAKALAPRLEAKGVSVFSLHPGAVATNFGQQNKGWFRFLFSLGHPFFLTAEQGAQTTIYLASQEGIEAQTGQYFAKSRPKTPTKTARNQELAEQLYRYSEELSGAPAVV